MGTSVIGKGIKQKSLYFTFLSSKMQNNIKFWLIYAWKRFIDT